MRARTWSVTLQRTMTSAHAQYPRIVERSAEAAHAWYRDAAVELKTEDLRYAARALRAVLHALRDRLSVEEAAQLAAQLPRLRARLRRDARRPTPDGRKQSVEAFFRNLNWEHVNRQLIQAEAAKRGADDSGAREPEPAGAATGST